MQHAIIDMLNQHTALVVTWLHFSQSSLPSRILVTTCPTLDSSKQLLGCIWDVFNSAEDVLQISIWADHFPSFGRDASDGRQTSTKARRCCHLVLCAIWSDDMLHGS